MTATTEIRLPSLNTLQSNLDRQESQEECGETKDVLQVVLSKLRIIVNGVNHVFIIFLTCFICFYVSTTSSIMYYHAVLCTVGYTLLMSEAILVFANENIGTFLLSSRVRAHVHWILQVLGTSFVIAGTVVMYEIKKQHFQSIHAITGIASIAIMIFLVVFGYPVLISARLRKVVRPVVVKFLHNFLGISCFVIGIVSLCYGFRKRVIPVEKEKWVSINDHTYSILVITIISAILTLKDSLLSLYTQFKSLFG